MKLKRPQQGYLMLVAVILIVVVGFISVTLTFMTYSSSFAILNQQKATSALYLAESALEDATATLHAFSIANRNACSGLSLSNNAIGSGAYSVTAAGPYYVSSPTTLTAALTATATTVTVGSTANYRSSGRIMIDQEVMNYAAVNATQFLFVQRGVDGTTAVAHVISTPVGQYQCELTAFGGDPKLAYSSGEAGGLRSLSQAVQLQEGWAVGNNAGGNFTVARWNNPTELSWNNVSGPGNFNLRSVFMTSYVDGWAVGDSNTFLRWDGSTGSAVASGLPNTNYYGVYCSSRNNCAVVGDNQTFGRWNGTTWTTVNPTGATSNNIDLRSIHCNSATNCWAVGTRQGNNRIFYNGTGNPMTWVGVAENDLDDYPFHGVFCNSNTDCWAVGNGNVFARRNGTAWVDFTTTLPNVQYNGVFCNSSTDCWAVGNTSGGQDVIVRWNGTSWSRDASNPIPAVNLNTVSCVRANDCWASGAASGGQPVFIHWNGTNWSTVATSGLPNATINSITFLGPNARPWAQWRENFA